MSSFFQDNFFNLPEVIPIKNSSGSYRFGFLNNLKKKLNINTFYIPNAVWEHGWHHGYDITENYNFFKFLVDKKNNFIMPKKKIADDILSFSEGKNKCIVAPLPFTFYIKNYFKNNIYTDDQHMKLSQQENVTVFARKFHLYDSSSNINKKIIMEYIDYVKDRSKLYENVTLCIHPEDIDNYELINQIKKYKIKFIIGVSPNDANGYNRMNAILKNSKYVDTNSIGSHVVYAAAKGIKVRCWMSKYELNKKMNIFQMKKYNLTSSFYKKVEEEQNYRQSNHFIKKYLNFLVTNDYEDHTKWAMSEIGYDENFSLDDAANILGLRFLDQILFYKNKIVSKINDAL